MKAEAMQGKNVLITGANAGIGKATALALAEQGARVVLACRSPERGEVARAEIARLSGNSAVELLVADLSALRDVGRLADEAVAACPRLDVVVLNAGVYSAARRESEDGLELTFAVNHLAHFLLVRLLLARLRRSAPARIVVVSSDAHRQGSLDFGDLQMERRYSGLAAYSRSKLCNVLFTRELALRIEADGVTVNALHPGVIATKLAYDFLPVGPFRPLKILSPFLKSPKRGARTSVFLAASPEVEGVNGLYFSNMKSVEPSATAHDPELARRLWEVSERLTGLA